MEITAIRVTPVKAEKVLAVVTLTLCDCFVLRAMRLVTGRRRRYVAMPTRHTQTGTFEVYHPITREARNTIESVIIDIFDRKQAGESGELEGTVYLGSPNSDFVITDVKVKPFEAQKLKGFASLVLDDCIAINGVKIIVGSRRSFIQMPNVKRGGRFRDLAFPIKPETRQLIEETIFKEYHKVCEG